MTSFSIGILIGWFIKRRRERKRLELWRQYYAKEGLYAPNSH